MVGIEYLTKLTAKFHGPERVENWERSLLEIVDVETPEGQIIKILQGIIFSTFRHQECKMNLSALRKLEVLFQTSSVIVTLQ